MSQRLGGGDRHFFQMGISQENGCSDLPPGQFSGSGPAMASVTSGRAQFYESPQLRSANEARVYLVELREYSIVSTKDL